MTEDLRDTVVASLVERLAVAGFVPADVRGSGVVNRVIECRFPGFAVRLAGDRGQWWAEGGLTGSLEWYDAATWASYLSATPLPDPAPIEDEVAFFIARREALVDAAGDEATWTWLRNMRTRRTRERLGMPPAEG